MFTSVWLCTVLVLCGLQESVILDFKWVNIVVRQRDHVQEVDFNMVKEIRQRAFLILNNG